MTPRGIYVAAASRRFTLGDVPVVRRLHWASRLLLVLIGILCAASPYTEYIWDWDGFARGGSDFELGAMTFVAVLCLAMVLLAQARVFVRSLLRLIVQCRLAAILFRVFNRVGDAAPLRPAFVAAGSLIPLRI